MMNSKNTNMGDGFPEWNQNYMFTDSQFDEAMLSGDSPYGTSAFQDFTNMDTYGESPGGLTMRAPSKVEDNSGNSGTGRHMQQGLQMASGTSAESSSQDSSSDSSSRRKRKTTESPVSDPVADNLAKPSHARQESSNAAMRDMQQVQALSRNLSIEQGLGRFDFNSAASSPIATRDPNSMSLDAQMHLGASSQYAHVNQASTVETINPGMFATSGGVRDQSPATANALMFNEASPAAIFSTPSSNSPEAFSNNQTWSANMTQNPAWPMDFSNQLTSPVSANFTPSPRAAGQSRHAATRPARSRLHIAPINTKSRVETQINVVMTLEKPPPGVEQLHLPLHTIAKSKLLAKDDFDKQKMLELHTMLVCTSAMHNVQNREKALQRAAAQDNESIQRRAEQARDEADENKNDTKNLDEADKPANGGEVRICSNCIQRERKRAGRKKTKREEEQQHWERYETERVVVFNSNEYLPFKPHEPNSHQQRDSGLASEFEHYNPPDGALQVTAAMRIACYCRHQSEKEGFRVIFTMKDHRGNVVAQEMSDSILITDDHKTHPQAYSTAVPNDGFYSTTGFANNGLMTSQSLVNIPAQLPAFTSSRSASNLHTLTFDGPFNSQSHVHQMPSSAYTSQTPSAAATPTSLSRPGSPSSAGQSGPNKKRKSSSSFHRKIPSGLQMTPRVDTSQPPSSNVPSAISMSSQFSPTNAAFPAQMNPSFMAMPNSAGGSQFFNSGPPTPSESGFFNFSQPQIDNPQVPMNQAYFSHPSSAVPSRANSPVLHQGRGNIAAYARQHPIQTSTNIMSARAPIHHAQSNSIGNDVNRRQYPSIVRCTPDRGPVAGGNEVAILGEHFVVGLQVKFGETTATTQFLSSTSIVATVPPSSVAGTVQVSILAPPNAESYPPLPTKAYTYQQDNSSQMLMLALKFLSEEKNVHESNWWKFAQVNANKYIQSRVNTSGLQTGYPVLQRSIAEMAHVEDMVLEIIDVVDMSESPSMPNYDIASETGNTMLSIACSSGMHRVAAALLARGANADVRDNCGYTPLMCAALHGRVEIFRLLIARGADATMRSLVGCSALDLAPVELQEELAQVLSDTRRQRRRNSRPSLHSRLSYSSMTSRASWDISSASCYESEVISSRPTSRRPSTLASIAEDSPSATSSLPSVEHASMTAWKDMLAAQILQLQENVQWNISNIQLPLLSNLPDCRRLGGFIPGKHGVLPTQPYQADSQVTQPMHRSKSREVFSSASGSQNCPPPAYHDLFPAEAPPIRAKTLTKNAARTAMLDAAADSKCAHLFDARSPSRPSMSMNFEGAICHFAFGNAKSAPTLSSWFLIALFAVTCTVLVQQAMVYLLSTSPLAVGFDPLQLRVLLAT